MYIDDIKQSGEKQIKVALCCSNYSGNGLELDVFINKIPLFFDGILMFNYDPDIDISNIMKRCDRLIWCENLDAHENYGMQYQLDRACDFEASWVCFINTNEIIDVRFCDFVEMQERSGDIKSVFFDVIHSKDNKNYYADLGVSKEVRMFNMHLLKREKVLESPDDSYVSHILLIKNVAFEKYPNIILFSKTFNVEELYTVGKRLENVGQISEASLIENLHNKVDKINDYFINHIQYINEISLYSGDSGILLSLSVYYMQTGDEAYLKRIYDYVDHIQELLMDPYKSVLESFCGGLAGYGWMLHFLNRNGIVEVDEGLFEQFDEVLFNRMKIYCKSNSMDQLHGALSIGRYFLARNNVAALKCILKRLDETKTASGYEIKWETEKIDTKDTKYDFGLAHGMAGYAYFISQCYVRGVMTKLCLKLLKGIRKFYSNNEQDFTTCHSFYPTIILKNEYPLSERNMRARLAWCYGDIGVLYSLFLVARNTGNKDYENEIVSKLEKVSARRDCNDTSVKDACFCHGASSIAHIFNRMYFFTGNIIFKESSVYWLKVTLILGRNTKESPTGYLSYKGHEKSWKIDYTLLEGVAGVNLTLMSALSYKGIDWDESMMLS